MRILHFSDVHVYVPLWEMPLWGMFNKRAIGAANLLLRRGRRFADAPAKLRALAGFADEHDVDLAICTGDYTALGTDPELRRARAAVSALTRRPAGLLTVPGNHDVYVPDSQRERRFERHFGDLLGTDLPEFRVDDTWPLVRFVGERVAVVGVNSARPNPQPWRSSGRIPDAQLRALERILADERVRGRFVFVMTHYAPRREDGSPDRPRHGLDNAEALLAALAPLRAGALLHGHIHRCFCVRPAPLQIAAFGAGSATDAGREGLWLFELDEAQAHATRGYWDGGSYRLSADRVPLGC